MIKREIINQSIDYITQHYDEDLSIEAVAEHFHFSKYYFCRSFKAATGESVYQFIKQLKLDQSAIDMKLEKKKSITDIGLDYGYSTSNYSTAFRKHHRLSPAEFRKASNVNAMENPFYPDGHTPFETYEGYHQKIKVEELPDFFVIYERMIGSYFNLKEQWVSFLDRYKEYIQRDTILLERFYNDPAVTSLDSCMCDICMTTDEACKLDNLTVVKGGMYATYRYEGEIQDIFNTIQGLFSIWMPVSGYEMNGIWGLNMYRKIDHENGHVIMDVCIPIK